MQVWVVVKQWHGKPAEILGLYHSLEKAGKVRTEAWQAHAGNGIVIARLSQIPAAGLSRTLVGQWQPVASAQAGHLTVWSNPGAVEATHQSVWGGMGLSFDLMTAVKRQFDPLDLLNPGRFVYVE